MTKVLIVVLGVLSALALRLARDEFAREDGPSIAQLNGRLQAVGSNRALATPAPGAALRKQEAVLCADSSSPHYIWHYAYSGPFEPVVAFYDGALRADGWTRGGTALVGSVEFDRRYEGWTAEGLVQPDADGYSLVVVVDDGYESGCTQ